jgi:hypothetical protein
MSGQQSDAALMTGDSETWHLAKTENPWLNIKQFFTTVLDEISMNWRG